MEAELLKLLNPEQNEIAKLRGLQILTACPGAGKTRIVGARLAELTKITDQTGRGGVAAITFTNSAAEEIRRVFRELTGRSISAPHFVGTIDSFFIQFIFQPFAHLGLGNPKIAPELVPPNSGLLNFRYKGYAYTALHQVKNKAAYTYDTTGSIVPAPDNQKDEIKDAVRKMKADMKAKNLATVADSAYWSLAVLRLKPELCRILAGRFPYIMIDEAQDCSDVQMALVDELVRSGHSEIMLIGDVFQAIYEFRRAQPRLLHSKTKENGWKSSVLVQSHRCRAEIVKLINCTAVPDDPAFRLIEACKVDCAGAIEIIEAKTPGLIAQEFLNVCQRHGINAQRSTTAILYGAHSSDLSRERISRYDIEKLFASDKREIHLALPLSLRSRLLGHNADALREAMEFAYLLKFGKSSHVAKHDRDDCDSVEALRPLLWKFCKSLPNADTQLGEWVKHVNQQLPEFLKNVGIESSFSIVLSRQVNDKLRVPLRDLLIGHSDYSTDLPLTATNVHQVKGRTFEAVLLYLDHGGKKQISGKKLIKLLNGERPFAKMTEDDRCIYVGITRAEKLLCFAGDVEELKQLLSSKNVISF
ncbi:ATP-dependent helicase [bacterium]|nr:ATP-dependent helicase [bacterium]